MFSDVSPISNWENLLRLRNILKVVEPYMVEQVLLFYSWHRRCLSYKVNLVLRKSQPSSEACI